MTAILVSLFSLFPPLHDVERYAWVDRGAMQELMQFNQAYQSHLHVSCEIRRTEWEVEAMIETRRLYDAWDALRDALNPGYGDKIRRVGLGKLRSMIGEEMYQRGQMPCFVPEWRFVHVR